MLESETTMFDRSVQLRLCYIG